MDTGEVLNSQQLNCESEACNKAETRRAYLDIKTTNNRIYAQYSGKKRGNSSSYSYSDLIYTFDWEGNPLERYELDCIIGGFDVDAAGQTIYAIKKDDFSIIRFDIGR
jgi:hypothetical protein